MHLSTTKNPWSYQQGFNMMVDFCIWVLEQDGLQVPPFDHHPAGDGKLQAAGMNAQNWRTWFADVVHLQYQQQQAFQKHSKELHEQTITLKEILIPEADDPPIAWQGSPTVSEHLAELWEFYGPISNQRRSWEIKLANKWGQAESLRGQRLWDELQGYKKRLPTLLIHLVAYPYQNIDYLIAPVSLIMTCKDEQPDGASFRTQLLSAAAELAAINKHKQQASSPYTFLPTTTKQSVHGFIQQDWPTVPPPQQTGTRSVAVNEQQQLILDQLEIGHMGLEVNMSTVQFHKSKTISGYHLHYISFEDTAGRLNDYTIFTSQSESGHWQHSSGGGMRADMNRYKPPAVYDHPMLQFQVGGGNWKGNNANRNQTNQAFYLGGEVIDNGFDVVHVRLLDAAGLVLEDTVEEGLILFVTKETLQEPLQIELYNRAGELVWKQPAIDSPPYFGRHRPGQK